MTTEPITPNPGDALAPLSCGCERSDAWRCAVARVLPTVSCHCSCHRNPPKELAPATIYDERTRIAEQKRKDAIAALDLMNAHGVASGAGGKRLVMLIPPTRGTEWTPEQALVLAAWLVAMAEPFSQLDFIDVLRAVQNT